MSELTWRPKMSDKLNMAQDKMDALVNRHFIKFMIQPCYLSSIVFCTSFQEYFVINTQ